jgi:Phosphotransferase enzyme family
VSGALAGSCFAAPGRGNGGLGFAEAHTGLRPGEGEAVRLDEMRPAPAPILDIPEPVAADLRIADAVMDPSGGSSATVWRVRTELGLRLVVKVLTERADVVDGHDLGTFGRKPRQIAAVHRELPGLSPYYTSVIGHWQRPGWAAYAMPHHDGQSVMRPLDGPQPDVDGFLRDVSAVFQVLTERGYAQRSWPAAADHFVTTHLDRVRRRLPMLHRHLPPGLLADQPIVINGRRCRSLTRLLAEVSADDSLLATLRPGRLALPVHGDLHLGNLLLRRGGPDPDFTVLDPRGVLAPWDPVYDFAKSLFSLTVFERAITAGLRVSGPIRAGGYTVSLTDNRDGYLAAAERFMPTLAELPYFRHLDQVDPAWRTRLRFAHACHCLAESACRLSDRKPRSYGRVRGWDACVLLSTGLLLHGIRQLDELLDEPRDRSAPGS